MNRVYVTDNQPVREDSKSRPLGLSHDQNQVNTSISLPRPTVKLRISKKSKMTDGRHFENR